jgi:ligand-binding sensor domain-containing protein
LSSTEGLSDDFTRSILQTKDGALWIGASNGLNRFYNNSITFYSYKNGLIGNEVNALCESADGSVWIGAAPGYITQYKNGKFIGIPISPENSPDPVYSLFEDSNGILWIGSENSLLMLKNGQVSRISTEKGLLRGLYTNIRKIIMANCGLLLMAEA